MFKMFAFGSDLYFQDAWNTFDFVVVAISVLELAISAMISMPSVASVLRLLRIFRVLRLVSSLKELEVETLPLLLHTPSRRLVPPRSG